MFILVVRGTHQYGDPNNMNAAWSKKWSHLEYDQFLIGNEDFSKWVIIDKESCVYKNVPATSKRFKLFQVELIGSDNNKYYDKQPIKVMASSSTCDPHTSKLDLPSVVRTVYHDFL